MTRFFKSVTAEKFDRVVRISTKNYRILYKASKNLSKSRNMAVSMATTLDHILSNHFYNQSKNK